MYDRHVSSRVGDILSAFGIAAGGVVVAFVHYFGGSPGDPEGWFAALGFAAPFIGAGLLALVGLGREWPALVFAAGLAVMPMSVVSIVLFPLIVPALVLETHAIRHWFGGRDLVVPAMLALPLMAAFAIVVFHQDPATWSTPTGSGGSSNIVTTTEAAIALTAAAAVVAIATQFPLRVRPLLLRCSFVWFSLHLLHVVRAEVRVSICRSSCPATSGSVWLGCRAAVPGDMCCPVRGFAVGIR